MGRLLAVLGAAAALAATPGSFLQAHRTPDGGYAESGSPADPALTAWAVLGLRASGADAPGALSYLQDREDELAQTSDVALAALAEEALGARPANLLARLHADERPTGAVGPTLNSTYWSVLALGEASKQTVRFIVAVSPDVKLDDDENLQWGIFTRFDPARDMLFSEQVFVGARPVYRGIIAIDATWKDGYPAPLVMDEAAP